jgi:hypothetical protein
MANMKWEKLHVVEPRAEFATGGVYRTPIPGGWLIALFWQMGHPGGPALCFYPDAEHAWDGGTLAHLELETQQLAS